MDLVRGCDDQAAADQGAGAAHAGALPLVQSI
jgi:hypothetical protein